MLQAARIDCSSIRHRQDPCPGSLKPTRLEPWAHVCKSDVYVVCSSRLHLVSAQNCLASVLRVSCGRKPSLRELLRGVHPRRRYQESVTFTGTEKFGFTNISLFHSRESTNRRHNLSSVRQNLCQWRQVSIFHHSLEITATLSPEGAIPSDRVLITFAGTGLPRFLASENNSAGRYGRGD